MSTPWIPADPPPAHDGQLWNDDETSLLRDPVLVGWGIALHDDLPVPA